MSSTQPKSALQNILTKAHGYIQQAFELKGIGYEKRDEELTSIRNEIEFTSSNIDLSIEPSFVISQDKKTIDSQILENYRQCLLYALHTERINSRELAPMIAIGQNHFTDPILARMIAALINARAHLTALEILINIKNKHYDGRASKAAHAKHLKPSKKEDTPIIKALVKYIHYKNLDLSKAKTKERIDYISKIIININKEYKILDISDIGELKTDILEASLEITDKFKGPRARITDRLAWIRSQQPNTSADNENSMLNETTLTLNFNEGMKTALLYMLVEKFSDMPTVTIKKIKSIKTKEQIERGLALLSRGASLSEISAAMDT
ncbi:hypothetical protein [Ectopseudomonas guguanensis]|uniref:Uncharacterized protein n=1 Tax=Ectopseudomonas guguanensis TaxID=1198456 RepID=A0A1H0VS87_9GAMM|nr:hypothetical protein [Pseudomonas guguanensis]SDP81442.1 hypothetical protein SAMN05216213_10645 [Pseudomonas guguanensis]